MLKKSSFAVAFWIIIQTELQKQTNQKVKYVDDKEIEQENTRKSPERG